MGVSQRLERKIEALVGGRVGRECILMPSGRIALYCALKTYMSSGDALLMSPNNDDVIFFCVLAAGIRPVAAPISPADGNIDVDAISESTWKSVRGVLTTNLYGLPDRVVALKQQCAERNIPLIEDAAHAIETEVDGTPIGSFGTAAAFSLSKHVDADQGGILAIADPGLRRDLVQMRDRLFLEPDSRRRLFGIVKPPIRSTLDALGMLDTIRSRGQALLDDDPDRPVGHRMPLRAEALRQAREAGGGLDAFDDWARVDKHEYRIRYTAPELDFIWRRLRRIPADRARRVAGVEKIKKALPHLVAPGVRDREAIPLFRVPLLVADREGLRRELITRLVTVHYVYDPPLDDYAGREFIEPSTRPAGSRWWARHALPLNPLKADLAIDSLRNAQPAPAFG